jgi:hypothetical protein
MTAKCKGLAGAGLVLGRVTQSTSASTCTWTSLWMRSLDALKTRYVLLVDDNGSGSVQVGK